MEQATLFALGKRRSTCEDLRRLKTRMEAARSNARNLCRAGAKAIDSAAQNLKQEFKQTSAARKLIYYAIHAHLTDQHSQARGYRFGGVTVREKES